MDSDTDADQHVQIDRLTNEFALSFIDEILALDTQRTVARVFELVNEAVRSSPSSFVTLRRER